MPLQNIANQILTLADRRASTPVLVTPPYLSFRKHFFVELSWELASRTDRNLRIDWYRNLPGVRTILSDQLAAWHVKSLNRLLARRDRTAAKLPLTSDEQTSRAAPLSTIDSSAPQHPGYNQHLKMPTSSCTVQITAAIARPGGKNRDLVIGLSDVRQKLPDWTTAIWLGTTQEEVKRWQAA